jgi:hypothetical protein
MASAKNTNETATHKIKLIYFVWNTFICFISKPFHTKLYKYLENFFKYKWSGARNAHTDNFLVTVHEP